MMTIHIFTDGSADNISGHGGYGAVICQQGAVPIAISGYDYPTTSQRMELKAIIEGINSTNIQDNVIIYTDSQYACDTIKSRLFNEWVKNDWRNYKKEKVKNIDLWEEIRVLVNLFNPQVIKVKGHSGHPENDYADSLAKTQMYYCKQVHKNE